MKTTRTQFKFALRSAKRAEETERTDAFAEDLFNKKCDEFWRGIHKLNQSNSVHATIIDNITGDKNIIKYSLTTAATQQTFPHTPTQSLQHT